MRLAIVTAAFHASADDPFVPVWRDMVHALADRADVSVFPLRWPATGIPFVLDGARVVPLGHGMVRLRRSPSLWRAAVGAVDADHRRRPFDAVLALQAGEAGLVGALAAARIRRPLHVHVAGGEVVCHRELGYGSQCRWVERAQVAVALRRAAVVTTGCAAMAERARRFATHRQAERVHVAPLGIESDPWLSLVPVVRARTAAPDAVGSTSTVAGHAAEPVVLAVADFRPIKDHDLLLRAFARVVAARPARLHLVGAGETLGDTLRLGARLGVEARLRCWGWVHPLARHVPFCTAHAFVHASRHEAQGMALIEAAMLGLPIASTRVGVADALPQTARILAEVGDEAGLARAIHAALDAASEPVDLRCARRAAVAAAFDRDAAALRWLDLLAAVSDGRSASEAVR